MMTTFLKYFAKMHKFWSLGLELQVSTLGVFDEVSVSVSSRNFKQVSVSKVTVSTTSLLQTQGNQACLYNFIKSMQGKQRMQRAWASEGFFPGGGPVGDFPKICSREAKNGEIWFLPLEIEKTTFFANNVKIHGGLAPPVPPSDTRGKEIKAEPKLVSKRYQMKESLLPYSCKLFFFLWKKVFLVRCWQGYSLDIALTSKLILHKLIFCPVMVLYIQNKSHCKRAWPHCCLRVQHHTFLRYFSRSLRKFSFSEEILFQKQMVSICFKSQVSICWRTYCHFLTSINHCSTIARSNITKRKVLLLRLRVGIKNVCARDGKLLVGWTQ